MAKEIAVFVRESGETASLYELATLQIYRRKERVWQLVREQTFEIRRSAGLPELRRQMRDIVGFLGDCRVVVAEAFQGVPFFELEKAGCNVWEFSGKPAGFLDYIQEQEEAAAQETSAKQSPEPPKVEDLGEGHWKINIREIQQGSGGVTSKQAVLPILRQGGFYQLEIVCAHLPPWLEGELIGGPWDYVAEKQSDQEWRVYISRKVCSPTG